MNKNQKGFNVVEALIIVAVLGVLSFVGWRVFASKDDSGSSNSNSESSEIPTELIWQQTDGGWQATQTAPACPDQPMMNLPVELSAVTSVLYPGQTRGGNYKPHGGFRFDNSTDNAITVTAPMEGFVMRGASYIEAGEVQYTFDIFNNCGVMYRFDHLAKLSDEFQKIADSWPAPTESSASHQVQPAVAVKAGATIATTVGFLNTGNSSVDWGVYDFRTTNQASQSASYRSAHEQDKELSWHAVCWLKDWIPSNASDQLLALPAGDSKNGKTSDYCE